MNNRWKQEIMAVNIPADLSKDELLIWFGDFYKKLDCSPEDFREAVKERIVIEQDAIKQLSEADAPENAPIRREIKDGKMVVRNVPADMAKWYMFMAWANGLVNGEITVEEER